MLRRSRPIFNWKKVHEARRNLARGLDVGDVSLDWLIDRTRLVQDIREAADLGPWDYRDLCCATLMSALEGVFDPVDVHREYPIGGGKVDLRMGFDQHGLDAVPSLRSMCDHNHARSLLVEVKQESNPVGPQAVNQLAGYLNASSLDNGIGVLVAKSGITQGAINQIISLRRQGVLIIPLQHADLKSLANTSSVCDAARHLRRRSAMLSAA